MNVKIQTLTNWFHFLVKFKKCVSEWSGSEAEHLEKGSKLRKAHPDCFKRAQCNKMLSNSCSSLSLLFPAVAARFSSSSLEGKTPSLVEVEEEEDFIPEAGELMGGGEGCRGGEKGCAGAKVCDDSVRPPVHQHRGLQVAHGPQLMVDKELRSHRQEAKGVDS